MGHFKGRASVASVGTIATIATIATVALLAAACSDTTESGGPAGGGSTDTGPRIPTTGPDATAMNVVFAVDQFFLGESDWDSKLGLDAWKMFGADLDGLASTKLDDNHCQHAPGASKAIQIDGDQGLDNSFGQNVTPFIDRFEPNPTNSINVAIADGDFTTLIRVLDLNAAGEQGGISAGLYAGADIETPVWDGSDVWPVYASSTTGDDLDKPTTRFDSAYVLDDKWNSGKTDRVVIPIVVGGVIFPIGLNHASITMEFNADRTEVTRGIIAGLIDPTEFVDELRIVAGSIGEELCEGALFDSIAAQIYQSTDIMSDSTNGDSSARCEAISIGLGFTAKRASMGQVIPDPIGDDPCAG